MDTYSNFIAGDWVSSSDTILNINPSDTNDVVGEYATASLDQLEDAISAASHASRTWGVSGVQLRADCLDRIGSEILARKDELGTLLAREEGKTLPEAIGEVGRAGQIFKFYAGEALRIPGMSMPSVRPGVDVEIRREALGVVGLITPWNFPIAIPAWKIAPALAYGNTVILKPAELTPGSTWALADIISRSGLPSGVFNLVNGPGRVIGEKLLNDDRVSGISFTGSVNTGRIVSSACSARGAKAQLEMGGKNPLIVLADADMDTAVNCALNGAFFSTGQRCTASSRLIVEDAIHDAFVDALKQKLDALVVGHALDMSTQIGPVVDQRQFDQNQNYLTIAREEGAQDIYGGEAVEAETPGFFMKPALIVDTANSLRINQEEIFGPVATTIRVSDLDEAMAVANDTRFGLSAGICTTSLNSARRFQREAKAGMVMVNLPTAGVDYHVPFGGTKASSQGSREQGSFAAEFYTSVKTAYIGS
ncbi:aldehyde dehydrogenase family protein [Hyphomonas sp. FCG-A18]|uniref:aldehyde dehydrogenase family protein n=1 Tax=Hyphomonas sp. FCG-A18 TaxID=3080019 RepID=UPI002B2C199B|nr:aldehyde dehydrogenase family protein [Hyphomonas sp. FCG-A18]